MTRNTLAVLEALQGRIATHLDAIRGMFTTPMKVTLLVRDPSRPDGSRDVFLTSDDLDLAIAAMRVVDASGIRIPGVHSGAPRTTDVPETTIPATEAVRRDDAKIEGARN